MIDFTFLVMGAGWPGYIKVNTSLGFYDEGGETRSLLGTTEDGLWFECCIV